MTCPSWPPPSGQAPLSIATSLRDSVRPAWVAARAPPAWADLCPLAVVDSARLEALALGTAARAVWADAVRRVATAAHSTPPTPWTPGWARRCVSLPRSAHLSRANIRMEAREQVLIPEALPGEVPVIDVGVAAGARHDEIGHELTDRGRDLVAVARESGA